MAWRSFFFLWRVGAADGWIWIKVGIKWFERLSKPIEQSNIIGCSFFLFTHWFLFFFLSLFLWLTVCLSRSSSSSSSTSSPSFDFFSVIRWFFPVGAFYQLPLAITFEFRGECSFHRIFVRRNEKTVYIWPSVPSPRSTEPFVAFQFFLFWAFLLLLFPSELRHQPSGVVSIYRLLLLFLFDEMETLLPDSFSISLPDKRI